MSKRVVCRFIFLIKVCCSCSLFSLTVISYSLAAASNNHPRASFAKNYFSVFAGYSDFNYTNNDLLANYSAQSFARNKGLAFQIALGHYFNPHFAWQLALMRPAEWVRVYNINALPKPNRSTIWTNVLSLGAHGRYPLRSHLIVEPELGLALVSRHGIYNGGQPLIPDSQSIAPWVGLGLVYNLTSQYDLGGRMNYVWSHARARQPSIVYAGLSGTAHFDLTSQDITRLSHGSSQQYTRQLELGGFDRSIYYAPLAAKLPIFWDGDVKTHSFWMLSYSRPFYSREFFSLHYGVGLSVMKSAVQRQTIFGVTAFPEGRLWLLQRPALDIYFSLSLAGLTFLTREVIDRVNTGGWFTFFDYEGIGCDIGRSKRVGVSVKVSHFSNGNLFPQNPGIAVPLTINFTYLF